MGMLELTGRVKMDNNFEYIFSHFSSVDGKKNIYIYNQIEAKTNNNNNNSIPKFCIMSFNFGSGSINTGNTNGNNWGSSSGFGRRASVSGPTATTTSTSTSTNTFGNTTGGGGGGGLFGNLNTNTTTTAAGSGLFGNSSNNAANSSGTLFGNSTNNASNAASTNLFGNSSSTSGGGTLNLFGNSNTNNNQTNTSGTTNLFGSTAKPAAATTSLFGNNAASTTSNLFGASNSNTNTTGGALGNAGGLFSNNNNNNTTLGSSSGGLFGNSGIANGGGLFGNSQQNNNLQAPSNQLTVNNNNPYSYSQVISNLQANTSNMPESITTSLFSGVGKESSDKKRRFSYLEKLETHKPKSSLLSKLGQTFKFIRNGNTSATFESLKGLFTSSDVLKPKEKRIMLSAAAAAAAASSTPFVTPKAISRPSYKAVDARRVGSMKRLIIKSKPMKYHMIDVNKVFNTKRRKVIDNKVTADRLLTASYPSDDDSDDENNDDNEEVVSDETFARYSYKTGNTFEESETKSTTRVVEKEPRTTKDEDKPTVELHDGYWSTPTIQQLSEMNVEQLSSLDNFIIGRVGCGQIAYDFPVDLSQIYFNAQEKGIPLEKELFGKVIELNPKVVLAYQNYPNKPQIGFGLNVPATITLEGIEPKANLSVADHINFLRQQIGMEFVTYDPITYVWVFKVKHFSIWGLIDEDNDSQKDWIVMKRKQDAQELEASLEYSQIYENEKYKQELKKQKLNEKTKVVPGGWEYVIPSSEEPLNIKRRLVSDEISQQLIKYQQQHNKTEELSAQVSDITIDSDHESTTPKLVTYMDQLANFIPPGVDLNEIIDEKVYEPTISNEVVFDSIQIRPNLPTSEDWLLQLELANQLTSALAPYVTEPKKKLDKLNIERVDDILFSDFNKNVLKVSTPTKKKLSVVDDIDESQDIYIDNISTIFHKLLSKIVIGHRGNEFPKIDKTTGFEFKDIITSHQEREEKDVTILCSALFDNLTINEPNPAISAALVDNTRKKLLGDWLKNYNSATVEKLLAEYKNDPLETTFIYMCSGDMIKAIETAIQTNNSHLSVVITLSDSNDVVVKSIAQNQLTNWKQRQTILSIPSAVVKVYQILAGDFQPILETLPWNLGLALKLFYGNYNDIKKLINEFSLLIPIGNPVGDVLHAYVNGIDLESVTSSSLNIKLKWLFCKVLADFNYDTITKEFGDYLLSIDYWKESTVVFAHLTNDNDTGDAITKLINSKILHIKSLTIDKEQYAIEVLKIPRMVIYKAVAIQKSQNGDFWGECEALIEVSLWEKAHITIVNELGPKTVISNSQNEKSQLQNVLFKFPENGLIISDWNKGAGIYGKYLIVLQNESDLSAIKFLLDNLPLTNIDSFHKTVALDIISKFIGNLIIENDQFNPTDRFKILNLPLGDVNKRFFELRLAESK